MKSLTSRNTLQNACLKRIEEAYKIAEAHYGTVIKRVPVTFSSRQTKTAGTAQFTSNRASGTVTSTGIKLATKLLELNGEDFINRTPGHEAAHCIAVELFGRIGLGHGAKWQEVMNLIGQKAEQFHNMKTPGTGFRASCGCQVHDLTRQQAKKLIGGSHMLRCNKCKISLTMVTSEPAKAPTKAPAKAPAKAPRRAKAGQSNAELVRQHIRGKYATLTHATADQAVIIAWASSLFKTRSAARSCVIANTIKVFK